MCIDFDNLIGKFFFTYLTHNFKYFKEIHSLKHYETFQPKIGQCDWALDNKIRENKGENKKHLLSQNSCG